LAKTADVVVAVVVVVVVEGDDGLANWTTIRK